MTMRRALIPLAPVALAPALLANAPLPDPVAATAASGEIQSIPPALKSMLDAAMTSGSEAEVATIAKYAAGAAPDSAADIQKLANDWKAARRAAADRTLREAGFLDLMRGRIEVGGFMTSGNTDTTGLTAIVDLTREGFRWRHKLKLLGEYQESAGVVSREHYLAAYEPNFKVDDRLYIYGAAQYESDRFLGYMDRYSASAGAGYTAWRTPDLKLDVELGPSFRRTDFTEQADTSELGARGSLDFNWRVSPGITVTQAASAYIQNINSTVTGRTAVQAKLFGPLSAQLSYAVSYESRPAVGRVNTDTTSRASLVYAF
ncbi:DUF481 domain-containing protein [Sphingomonas donggukensis]|uniref:DUF481 domain-containing protein n=1 Tax=Sphingomonas donggukensis TaxID=2949093 RepID=A0ABY4TZ70_9SPHN|nr:DUF481 domain-containing protein [Sphingomonas donggukensis]URW76857.1 DUF481 domain-containing protein [Sphingomonas donggukensis]